MDVDRLEDLGSVSVTSDHLTLRVRIASLAADISTFILFHPLHTIFIAETRARFSKQSICVYAACTTQGLVSQRGKL